MRLHTNEMLLLYFSVLAVAVAQLSDDPDTLLNWCLKGINHKTKQGPEDELHLQCTPWKNRSCCTYETTYTAHSIGLYNFNYNHCSPHNMSRKCHQHFLQDLCFYECSPNIGPWIVKVDMKIRKEKFLHVPLCASDCDVWFEDCKNDYTCTDNWGRNFVWGKDGNKCPPNSECLTFKEVFRTAENFCQKVWDESWKYTPDDKPCMRIWFDGNQGNPNDNVARHKVLMLLSNASKNSQELLLLVVGFISYWFWQTH